MLLKAFMDKIVDGEGKSASTGTGYLDASVPLPTHLLALAHLTTGPGVTLGSA